MSKINDTPDPFAYVKLLNKRNTLVKVEEEDSGGREVSTKTAHRIAQLILIDCLDRKGIKQAFAQVSREVVSKEILPAWSRLIDEGIATIRAEERKAGAVEERECVRRFRIDVGGLTEAEADEWLEAVAAYGIERGEEK